MFGMLKDFFKRTSYGIHKKIFFFYSVSSLVLIIALSFIISSVVREHMRNQINYYVGSTAQQLNNNLDYYIDEMKNTLMAVSFNNKLGIIVDGDYLSDTEKYEAFKDFNNSIVSIMSTKKYNELFILVPKKRYILSTNINSTVDSYNINAVENTPWYKKIVESQNAVLVLDNFNLPSGIREKISFAIVLSVSRIMPDYDKNDCYIIMTSYEALFDNLLKGVADNLIDFFVIADNEGNILYNTRKNYDAYPGELAEKDIRKILLRGNIVDTVRYLGDNYFININSSRNTNWKVIFFSSENRFTKSIERINLVILLITVLISVFMFAMSYYIASGVTNPVKKLMRLMKEVENNNLNVRSNIANNDEIGDLSQSFNNMISRINILVNEILEGQILRREAEIYALQQQINPHFLYNTLEAINSLANRERYREIRVVVQKMASIFQYCINRKRYEFVQIREEIQYLENYMIIQGIRFNDKIKIHYEIDPAVYDMWTIKFILQPIVENSIHHGFEVLENTGLITVRGTVEDDAVTFEIEDNGVGIGEEELKELESNIWGKSPDKEKERGSIGLQNVNSRINLMFKGDYGIRIDSKRGSGTRVFIRFPAIDEKGDRLHDEGSCGG